LQDIIKYIQIERKKQRENTRVYCITSQVCSLHGNVGPIYRIQHGQVNDQSN